MNNPSAAQQQKRPEFVTLIAVYQFITAGILFLLSCLIPVALISAIVFYVDASEGVFGGITIATAIVALALLLGFGFASVVVGWGLLRMREWARLGAIVLGAFALIGFPIWTIVAILVLVYMTSEEARRAFAARPLAQSGDPRYHDALAPQAAYKAEPPSKPDASPLAETRPMTSVQASPDTAGGRIATPPPQEESHQIDPIPMPPGDEQIADSEAETTELEIVPGEPDEKPRQTWFRPPEEAGMDDRIIRPRENDENQGRRS
jgi:hypothetical protein